MLIFYAILIINISLELFAKHCYTVSVDGGIEDFSITSLYFSYIFRQSGTLSDTLWAIIVPAGRRKYYVLGIPRARSSRS